MNDGNRVPTLVNAQSPAPRPGWYGDPLGDPTRLRFWDGAAWTDDYRNASDESSPGAQEPPKSLDVLAGCAVATLVLAVIAELYSLLAGLSYRNATDEVLSGLAAPITRVQSAVAGVNDANTFALVAFVLAALAFIPWFYRAYANLPRMGVTRLRHAPGWAIGGWFVPFLNLIRPKEIANDIYRGSVPAARTSGDPTTGPAPAFLHWWWAMFLIAGLAMRIGVSMVNTANNTAIASRDDFIAAIEKEQDGVLVTAVSSGLAIVAATLAILFVLRVTRMQRDVGEKPAPLRGGPTVGPAAAASVMQAGSQNVEAAKHSVGPPGWS